MSENGHEMCLSLWAKDLFNQVWNEYQQTNPDQIPLNSEEIQSKFLQYVQNEFLVLAQSFIHEKISAVSKEPSAVAVTTIQPEVVGVPEDNQELCATDLPSATATKQNHKESDSARASLSGPRCYSMLTRISPFPTHKCDFCGQWFYEYDEKIAHIRSHGRKSVLVMREPPPQPELEPEAELEPMPVDEIGITTCEFTDCEFEMEIAQEVEVTTSPSNPLSELSDSPGEKSDDSDEVEFLQVVINQRDDDEMSLESKEGYSSGEKDYYGKMEKVQNFGKSIDNTDSESSSQNQCLVETSLHFLEMPGLEIVTNASSSTVQEKPLPSEQGPQKRRRSGVKTSKMKFKCTDCSKVCISQSQLSVHFRVHSGEKPYTCNLCGKLFSQKGNADRHMSAHAREKQQFSCDSCPERFKNEHSLIKHQLKKHVYGDPN